MGILESFRSFASSVVSSAVSAVSRIGGAISSFATSVGSAIAGGLNSVGGIFSNLARSLGLIKPEEDIEELGDRALQAAEAGIQPQHFERYEQYMAEIRQFRLDPHKSESYAIETKKLAGIGVTCAAIDDRFNLREGSAGQLAAMSALNPNYFNTQRLENWLRSGQDISKVIDYFDNKLGASEQFKVEQNLIATEKSIDQKSEAEIEQNLEQAKTDLYQAAQKAQH